MTELLWDPANPAHIRDPYPVYARLRLESPVWRHPVAWVLSRHDQVEDASRDPRLLNHGLNGELLMGALTAEVRSPIGDATLAHQRSWVLFQSGTRHLAMRRLLNRGFTPASLERLRTPIALLVDDLLARVRDEARFDFINDVALPLPVTVICELFGVPEQHRDVIHELLTPLGQTMSAVPVTLEVMRDVDRAVTRFDEVMRQLLDERRAHPQDDLISLLANPAPDEVEVLTDDDLVGNAGVLLFAGHETTAGLLGNGMLALLQHPDQRAALATDPGLTKNAVEELLRYDAPAQRTARIAHEPLEIGGQEIARGDLVWLLVGSANRDPDAYDQPDELDFHRPEPKPLSFGKGPHLCLGAPLARLEAQIALPKIVEALAAFNLEFPEVSYNPTATLRCPAELVLRR